LAYLDADKIGKRCYDWAYNRVQKGSRTVKKFDINAIVDEVAFSNENTETQPPCATDPYAE